MISFGKDGTHNANLVYACIGILVFGLICEIFDKQAISTFSIIPAPAWQVLNVLFWFLLKLSWVYRFDSKNNAMGYTIFAVLIMGYAVFCGTVAISVLPAIMGIPTFPLFYGPPLMVYMYFLLMTPTGKNLGKNVPWEELLVASAYRWVMEIPWAISMEEGTLPWILANPFQTVPPYQLVIGDMSMTFTSGLAFDGLPSMFLGPGLALLYIYRGSLPALVLWGYQFFGIMTLSSVVGLIVSNFPQPNILQFWVSEADTGSFLVVPGIIQGFFGSMTGWIINVIAFRKLLGK